MEWFNISQEHLENGKLKESIVKQINNSGVSNLIVSQSTVHCIPSFKSVSTIYIDNCPHLTEIDDTESLTKLSIRVSGIRTISNFRNLESLTCEGLSIKSIPYLENLRYLFVAECTELVDISRDNDLFVLYLENCRIRSIPSFKNLIFLSCRGLFIENLPKDCGNLSHLYCSSTSITYIPDYQSLNELSCTNCRKINKFPYLKKLEKLNTSVSVLFDNIETYNQWKKRVDCIVLLIQSNILNTDVCKIIYKF